MATLTYMPTEHVPVLAPELIALLDPQPGRAGRRLHLRRRRPRPPGRRADRADRAPDLRSTATRRRGALRRARARARLRGALHRAPTSPTRSSASLADGVRPDVVYMDLGISSLQLDAAERGFSYAYDAPLDMRMDTSQPLIGARGRQRVARAPARPRSASSARSATRARSPPRSSAGGRSRPPPSWSRRSAPRSRPRTASAAAIPAKRTFQAIRIAVNGELDSLDRALPPAWSAARRRRPARGDLLPLARGPPGEAVPRRPRARLHLPARAPGLPLRARARGRAARAARA